MDVESKLPKELRLRFLTVRPDERLAALLVLLKNVINEKEQTVIFAATKHHVEYLHLVGFLIMYFMNKILFFVLFIL